MNAPPWPLNPSVGQMFMNWAWSGSQWIATPTTGLRVITQIFTQSGNYMPSPGLVSLIVECVGGGGAGGWAGGDPGYIAGGGGGGSGGYSRKTLPAALVRGGVPVTIGQGGQPVNVMISVGNPGGPTSFGALCVANGGYGGYSNDITDVFGAGGGGANAGIGDIELQGNMGQNGCMVAVPAGATLSVGYNAYGGTLFGGDGFANLGHVGPGGVQAGAAGSNGPGSGGQGGLQNQNAPPHPGSQGGAGGSGMCIVTEYCWGDRDDVNAWSPPVNVNLNVRNQPGWLPPPGPWPPGTLPPGPWPRSEDDP